MQRMAGLERESLYHLILITKTGAQNESKNGQAHLAEHTCLAPVFAWNKEHPETALEVYGETCLHYMLLYVAGPTECREWIDAWADSVLKVAVVTNRNVSIARRQVSCECNALRDITEMNRQILDFVSDHRIQALPIGTVESIADISVAEISEWLSGAFKPGEVWKLSFQRAEELWRQYQAEPKIAAEDVASILRAGAGNRWKQDRVLPLTDNTVSCRKAEYFFPLPNPQSQSGYLTLLFFESFLACALDERCPLPSEVTEKFFTSETGFLSIQIDLPVSPRSVGETAMEWLEYIRKMLSKLASDFSFFSEALGQIATDISQIKSAQAPLSTTECLAQIISGIVYGRPLFGRAEAVEMFEFLVHHDFSCIGALAEYLCFPAKIVLHLPVAG